MLRQMEADIANYEEQTGKKQPELRYRVEKERLTAYMGWRKVPQCHQHYQELAAIAQTLTVDSMVEDWLLTKAAYCHTYGTADECTRCFTSILQRRRQGKSLQQVATCYADVIALAKKHDQPSAAAALATMYQAWQDSIAVQRVEEELHAVQGQLDSTQVALADCQSAGTTKSAFIGILSTVALALAAALAFFILLWGKSRISLRRLKRELSFANDSNRLKADFIQHIGDHLAPSLDGIAQHASQAKGDVECLKDFLADVAAYTQMEQQLSEPYPQEATNVRTLCENVTKQVRQALPDSIVVDCEAPATRFTTCAEEATRLLADIALSTAQQPGTTHIHIEFKKRGPHSGSFLITNHGGSLNDEQRQSIFTAFSGTTCPGDSTSLRYPICALRALRLGGTLALDDEFRRGTRFVLKVEE